MRVTLVHNPGAGDESHTDERLLRELAEAGYEAEATSTKQDELERKLEHPGALVVVAGGDGSVKKVAVRLAGRGVPLAILPIGTANNIAKSLGVYGKVRDLMAGWRHAERRRLRVGTVATRWGSMRLVESVGVGVFTELVIRGEEEVDENAAGLTGHAIDRALLLLQRIIAEREPRPRRVVADGADLSGEYLLVEAMNMPMLGPNVALAPDADTADDRLSLVTVTEGERPLLAGYVRARLGGRHAPLELPVRQARRITLEASPGELHVDDGPWKPEKAAANGTPMGDLPEGEVAVMMDEETVEVLIPPEA